MVNVNVKDVRLGKNTRKSFAKIREVQEMPNLIEVQKNSYKWFIEEGLKEVFEEVAAITDYNGNLELSFVDYRIDPTPKYTIAECKERDATYSSRLHVKARLRNNETGEVKESEVYMGDLPKMTESGTFVINGAERVIVSQLVRSPGVYFNFDKDKTGKDLFNSTIIPNRGAWLEYEMDSNDVVYVRIDKNRKIPITTFIRALGIGTNEEITDRFGVDERLNQTILQKDPTANKEEALLEVYRKLRPGEPPTVESAQTLLHNLFFDDKRYDLCRFGRYKYNKKLGIASRLAGHTVSRPIISPVTGELLAEPGQTLRYEQAYNIENAGVMEAFVTTEAKEYYVSEETGETNSRMVEREVKIIGSGMVDISEYITRDPKSIGVSEKVYFPILKEILDSCETEDEVIEQVQARMNELVPKHIILDDIIATISYFLNLCEGVGTVDDIDHLGNRRIRSVGELLQNQFRIGFTRMERVIRERMNVQSQDAEILTPRDLINIRPISAAIKEFFGSSPLSQFMDQNNPLAELTHKRRLSALGPGGLSRDRAGFEVRDVHYTHYGRMCPIETPEGPNIGLISYLASFARINEYGFIEAPYRRVDKETGVVTDEVVYMTADVEDNYMIAQANEPLTEDNKFARKKVNGRYRDQILEIDNEHIDFMDISPKMVVSVATACIPFLENDDANRALMGANMQRQAVPLLKTESPIVGTGMEYKTCLDSGVAVVSEKAGVVESVDADKIVVREDDGNLRTYELIKFKRSNAGTCTNQRPIVDKGERIEAHQIIGDGPATSNGELSLGKNALIGFMTWEGYNYEDAVLLNENLVRQDKYTSIHIEEYEIEARDTKLGPEEITRDIPQVKDEYLANLDENGIIRIGADVRPGDILVGKVTPKGETEVCPEQRLLRAIFGDKERDVRDNSLKVPHGESGTIIDVKVFTKENCEELSPGVNMLVRCYIAQKRKISVGDKMAGRHGNKGVVSRILPPEDMPFLEDGTPLDIVLNPLGVPSRMNIGQVLEVHLGMAAKALGWKIMTPVFDGAHEEDIRACFRAAQENYLENRGNTDKFEIHPMSDVINPNAISMHEDGKFTLYDGRTGEKFDNKVTVGYMYYLKLHHLVDDKIHARSTGPYALVTQQPLGGKAQFGGQRFGEMEVWALEAYGAAYTLQEILTVKSDDKDGRDKTYHAISDGQNIPKPGIPEAFKVLVKELQSLGLDLEISDSEGRTLELMQTSMSDEQEYRGPDMNPDVFNSFDEDEMDSLGLHEVGSPDEETEVVYSTEDDENLINDEYTGGPSDFDNEDY
ncbi:DNA-directed RNA polymerase subunit beta [Ruminococcus sp. YE71]|uniref:DNA-directed RNA polymerase subunit beta n=1 Tax=unclassified Ruminococcus TaxID=2608920 RepID=UPI000880E5D9|nr:MULTISPECIES: DNA-directed RNA polymerase subunit beta [unclassified Ruminococcus]SDA20241.1 DNA-directed RNA polymerase subunit beta [Ruminococcus sp. YE78]SFW32100.1 DNA-directed RNA polymerase subunit beta [Ruminococcus sp. YE71]